MARTKNGHGQVVYTIPTAPQTEAEKRAWWPQTEAKQTELRIRLSELTEPVSQVRLKYCLRKLGKSLRGLNARTADGGDPCRLLLQLAKSLRFPQRP